MSEPYGSFCPPFQNRQNITNTATSESGDRSLLNLYRFSTFYTLGLSTQLSLSPMLIRLQFSLPNFLLTNYLQALLAITNFHDSTYSVVAARYTGRWRYRHHI